MRPGLVEEFKQFKADRFPDVRSFSRRSARESSARESFSALPAVEYTVLIETKMKTPLRHDATGTFRGGAMLAFTFLTLTATVATAQNKTTGDGKCGKPEQQQSIDVGDRAGHSPRSSPPPT